MPLFWGSWNKLLLAVHEFVQLFEGQVMKLKMCYSKIRTRKYFQSKCDAKDRGRFDTPVDWWRKFCDLNNKHADPSVVWCISMIKLNWICIHSKLNRSTFAKMNDFSSRFWATFPRGMKMSVEMPRWTKSFRPPIDCKALGVANSLVRSRLLIFGRSTQISTSISIWHFNSVTILAEVKLLYEVAPYADLYFSRFVPENIVRLVNSTETLDRVIHHPKQTLLHLSLCLNSRITFRKCHIIYCLTVFVCHRFTFVVVVVVVVIRGYDRCWYHHHINHINAQTLVQLMSNKVVKKGWAYRFFCSSCFFLLSFTFRNTVCEPW